MVAHGWVTSSPKGEHARTGPGQHPTADRGQGLSHLSGLRGLQGAARRLRSSARPSTPNGADGLAPHRPGPPWRDNPDLAGRAAKVGPAGLEGCRGCEQGQLLWRGEVQPGMDDLDAAVAISDFSEIGHDDSLLPAHSLVAGQCQASVTGNPSRRS